MAGFKFNDRDKQSTPPTGTNKSNNLFEGVFKGTITGVNGKKRNDGGQFVYVSPAELDPYDDNNLVELEITFQGKEKAWTRNISIFGRNVGEDQKHPWIKMLEKLNLPGDADVSDMLGMEANFLLYACKPNAKGYQGSEVWTTFAADNYCYYGGPETLEDWFVFAMKYNNKEGKNKYRSKLHPESQYWTLYYKNQPKDDSAAKGVDQAPANDDLPF